MNKTKRSKKPTIEGMKTISQLLEEEKQYTSKRNGTLRTACMVVEMLDDAVHRLGRTTFPVPNIVVSKHTLVISVGDVVVWNSEEDDPHELTYRHCILKYQEQLVELGEWCNGSSPKLQIALELADRVEDLGRLEKAYAKTAYTAEQAFCILWDHFVLGYELDAIRTSYKSKNSRKKDDIALLRKLCAPKTAPRGEGTRYDSIREIFFLFIKGS